MTEEKLREALLDATYQFVSGASVECRGRLVASVLSVIAPVLAFKDDEISTLVQELNKRDAEIAALTKERDDALGWVDVTEHAQCVTRRDVRNAALEEAANVAENHPDSFGQTISTSIRALISKE